MRINLRGEEPETGKARVKAEQGVIKFIRYFFPAVWPVLLYISLNMGFILIGSMVFRPGVTREEFLHEKSSVCSIFTVFTTFFILRRYSRKKGSTFFEDASLYRDDLSLVKGLMAVLFGAGTALFISALISLLPSIGPVEGYEVQIGKLYRSWSILFGVAVNTFFTPLVEEVIFRGYMLNRLLPHWGEKWALIAVSLVFGMMHGSAIWFLYSVVMAWILGKLAIREDNIFYSILLHLGFNLPGTVLWYMYALLPGSEEVLRQDKLLITALGFTGAGAALFAYRVYELERTSGYISRLFNKT